MTETPAAPTFTVDLFVIPMAFSVSLMNNVTKIFIIVCPRKAIRSFLERKGLPPAHSVERSPIVSIFSEFTQPSNVHDTTCQQCFLQISTEIFQRTVGITLTHTGHDTDFLCHLFLFCRIAAFISNRSISLFCKALFPSRKILDGINRPAGNFADICTDSRNVAQQEEGGKA